MSTQLWTIIGVAVGAIIPGGIGFAQAFLQRRWSADDADQAWDREKQDRIFEAKRAAHTAFTDALHKTHSLVLQTLVLGGPSIDNHPGIGPAVGELMHLQAQLYIYASPDASEAAGEAADALLDINNPQQPASELEHRQNAYHRARAVYLAMARVDIGVEDIDVTLDDLKGLNSADVDPEQSA